MRWFHQNGASCFVNTAVPHWQCPRNWHRAGPHHAIIGTVEIVKHSLTACWLQACCAACGMPAADTACQFSCRCCRNALENFVIKAKVGTTYCGGKDPAFNEVIDFLLAQGSKIRNPSILIDQDIRDCPQL